MSREDGEARPEAEALTGAPSEFVQAVDDYGMAVEQLVLARAQVHKWKAEVTRLRDLLIELESQER